MTHSHLYTFTIDEGRVLQFKNNIQIARLHSFSYNKTDYTTAGITILYENLLACSNHDGTIVIIDLFSRRKKTVKTAKTQITTLAFLNAETLVSTNINELVKVHDLKTLNSINITNPSLLHLLKNKNILDLESLSSTLLTPLIANNSLEQLFELIKDNYFLKGTIEHINIDNLYSAAFKKSIEALRSENKSRADKLLEKFKDVESKRIEIKTLFEDFKHFERFKQHIFEKNYSIAYAISSTHTNLKLTPEYKSMEAIYQSSFKLAQNQMLIGKKELAKESLKGYVTILCKRDEIKNLLNSRSNHESMTNEEKLLLAYEKNDFKKCYELIDNYSIHNTELITLLERHWVKLMLGCEDYALDGDIKSIKRVLGGLLGTKTRVDKIGDLLRVAFHSKIKSLQKSKKFSNAENIIYSYIDIFGVDIEIKNIMKRFEKESSNKLAITQNQDERVLRENWLNADIIMEN